MQAGALLLCHVTVSNLLCCLAYHVAVIQTVQWEYSLCTYTNNSLPAPPLSYTSSFLLLLSLYITSSLSVNSLSPQYVLSHVKMEALPMKPSVLTAYARISLMVHSVKWMWTNVWRMVGLAHARMGPLV